MSINNPLRGKHSGEVIKKAGGIIKDKKVLSKVLTSPRLIRSMSKLILQQICNKCRGKTIHGVMRGKMPSADIYCDECREKFIKLQEKYQ